MSINCANFCLYQIDGICNLKNHEKKAKGHRRFEKTDCPYFEKDEKFTIL